MRKKHNHRNNHQTMELRQLKYFVTVADTLNFSEASRRLFITQGTLSQQIRQLEDELGCQLFDRDSHNVYLTDAGEELLPLAERTLDAADNCRIRMNDLRAALVGTLNIGVTHSFSGLFTETVKEFLKTHPGVSLNIIYKTASELIDMLHEKTVDLILAFKTINHHEDIETETLFSTKLCVVMRRDHPLAEKKHISLADLEKQGIVLPGIGMQARKVFESFVGLDTRKLDVRVELNDPGMIMDLVLGTNLVSLISSLASYYRPGLVAIPLEEGSHVMSGCVQWLKDGYRKKSATVFIDMLRDSALIERICRKDMD